MFKRMVLVALSLGVMACSPLANPVQAGMFSVAAKPTTAASMNGRAGAMPAFYDGVQFTVNMKQLPAQASASLIAHNRSINEIFATNDLDEPQDFAPVIDAIQGDGFNPLWRQVLISWNPGFTPRQLTSDDEVAAAAAAGEITLTVTDEVYRCSVIGPKP